MISTLTALWTRLTKGGGRKEPEAAPSPAVEYKGFRIVPAPYPARAGQFQTAGTIEKDFPPEVKRHEFVRAETHGSREDAAAFAIAKGKQIIDEQGERLFSSR
jgi:hypothetical protein